MVAVSVAFKVERLLDIETVGAKVSKVSAGVVPAAPLLPAESL